jgi:hypothetical protein
MAPQQRRRCCEPQPLLSNWCLGKTWANRTWRPACPLGTGAAVWATAAALPVYARAFRTMFIKSLLLDVVPGVAQ